jgi:hypothetical protein
MRIEDLVVELSKAPFDPEANFKVAVEYERLTQTASAVAFYHRTAEHGYETHPDLVYASLLRVSHCFQDQSDRVATVSNCLLQAIAYLPERPEAYLLMSQFAERKGDWQECYTWAEIGLNRAHAKMHSPLPVDTGYFGPYCFEFQKAVSGWWLGRNKESIELFNELKELNYIAPEYKAAIESNLNHINGTV